MSLSDHDRRAWRQIEEDLVAEDPDFVSFVRSVDTVEHPRARYEWLGILGAVALCAIFAFAMIKFGLLDVLVGLFFAAGILLLD